MAKKNKKGSNKPFSKQDAQQSKPAEKKSESKSSSNKPLIGVLVLIGLIALSAIGVGAYYAYQSLTSDDDSTEESSTDESESEDDEETSDQENDEENNSEKNESDEESNESNDQEDSEGNTDGNQDSESSGEENDDSASSENETETGSISESSAKTSVESNPGYQKSAANQMVIQSTGVWQATDYVPGDITQNEYQVQLGDTLWEIAEGYYGSGFEWGKILNSNQSKIGYLPNGEQALITPGTVLVLPQ